MKKKTLTIAIALVLVVALAVGATYAYLTATAGPVENTFVAGRLLNQDGALTLNEHKITTTGTTGVYNLSNDTTTKNDYTAIMPGVNLPKDPKVTVTGLVANAYLFVVADNALTNGLSATYDIYDATTNPDGKWVVVESNAAAGKTLLAYNGVLTQDVSDVYILKDNTVTVPSSLTVDNAGQSFGNLTFNAYLVQAAGFKTAAAAWNGAFEQATGITATVAP